MSILRNGRVVVSNLGVKGHQPPPTELLDPNLVFVEKEITCDSRNDVRCFAAPPPSLRSPGAICRSSEVFSL